MQVSLSRAGVLLSCLRFYQLENKDIYACSESKFVKNLELKLRINQHLKGLTNHFWSLSYFRRLNLNIIQTSQESQDETVIVAAYRILPTVV